jgi:hypothetical protein
MNPLMYRAQADMNRLVRRISHSTTNPIIINSHNSSKFLLTRYDSPYLVSQGLLLGLNNLLT